MSLNSMLKTERHCRVVIVQADHEDSLKVMDEAHREGLADFILIGDRNKIHNKSDDLKILLDGIDIRNADSDKEASDMAAGMASAGQPDILLFPDLNSANAVSKTLAFIPGCESAGILVGLKVPVVLTSRSDSEETRYLSLKLAMASALS
ncbi:MAG: hypothetical protein B6241_15510 [Spirochaetaceae bacterium 4572_59]|nr:MAG: hypothetical protein B6241_15510 [Spirochaetaceae bacterium 4572_59]